MRGSIRRDLLHRRVPRATGVAQSTYRNTTLWSATRPYTLWMVQRPLDAYRALDETGRVSVDRALAGTGWEAILALDPQHRVEKHDYQVVWSNE